MNDQLPEQISQTAGKGEVRDQVYKFYPILEDVLNRLEALEKRYVANPPNPVVVVNDDNASEKKPEPPKPQTAATWSSSHVPAEDRVAPGTIKIYSDKIVRIKSKIGTGWETCARGKEDLLKWFQRNKIDPPDLTPYVIQKEEPPPKKI